MDRSQPKLKITFILFILISSALSLIPPQSETSNRGDIKPLDDFQATQDFTMATRGLRVDVDVGIENVIDVTAKTQPDHYPGMPITISCTVRNYLNSNIPQAFEVVFTIDDNVPDVPGYHYQANQTITTAQLPPNGAVNLTWNWTPPLHAPPGSSWNFLEGDHTFTAIFTVIYDGDINTGNNQMKLDIIVKKSPYDIEIISGWGGIPEPVKTIKIEYGTTTIFHLNFTVFNFGKETWVDFEVIPSTGWQISITPPIFLASGANSTNENLTINVFPTIKREYSPANIELPITIKVICRSYPIEYDTEIFKVIVSFIPYPWIIIPYTITVQPGVIYVNFTIINDGNGLDSFRSEATVGQTPFEINKLKEQGWNATVHSGKFSKILERGENHTVTVKIEIPSTVPAGTPCLVNLTVFSERAEFICPGHPYAVLSGFVYIYSKSYKDADIQDYVPAIDMMPGSEATITFSVRNIGNGIDKTITCNVTEIPEGWNYTIDTSDIPFTGLGRQAVADIKLTIKTPKQVNIGEYIIKIAAISEDKIKDESNITIYILESEGIELSSEASWFVIEPGIDNIFNVSIENLGNSQNYFKLVTYCEPSQAGLEEFIVLEYDSVLLGSYVKNNLTVTIKVPKDFPADSDLHTYNLDDYELQIFIVKENAPEINDSLNVGIHINPIYSFEPSENFLIDYIVRNSGVGTRYKINISNTGNFRDTIRFSVEGINGSNTSWLSMPIRLDLEFQEYQYLFIDVDPPRSDLLLDDYEFIIKCISKGIELSRRSIKLVLKAIDFDLKITNIRIENKISDNFKIIEGQTVDISADVSYDFQELEPAKYKLPVDIDPRNSMVNITLLDNTHEIFNGTTVVNFFTDEATRRVTLSWTALHVDMHKLTVTVDPEDYVTESNEDNNTAEFFVQVDVPLSAGSGNSYIILITANSAIILTSTVILIGAAAFIGGTEVGKYNLLVGLLPLYTRIKRDKILDHEARGMIRGYIIANPGVHFNYLKRELGLKNGALAYHLKVLERGEFIKIQRDGMYTRLYPMKNGAYYKGAFNGVRLSELQKKIVRQIRVKPGITQKKIIAQTGIKQQTVSRNINVLVEKDVIKVQKKGRESCCYFNSEIELENS